MPTYTQEELLDRYEKLPQALKDAIFAETNADKMYALGQKNGLTIDQIGEIASETGYVMLGVTHPGDFVRNLKQKLNIDQEKAREIAEDINREIFRPIREHLKDLHKITDLEMGEVPVPESATRYGAGPIPKPEIEPPPVEEKIMAAAPPPPPDIPIQEEPPEEEKMPQEGGRAPMIFPQKIEEAHREMKEEIELPPKSEQEPSEETQEQPAEPVPPIHKVEVKEESAYKGQDPYREPTE